MSKRQSVPAFPSRRRFVHAVLLLAALILVGRLVDIHVVHRAFYRTQGDARMLRTVPIPAHRGMLTDRNGEPLAVSTPVESVWANPAELIPARAQWGPLARALHLDPALLEQRVAGHPEREFVYLRRQVPPPVAQQVRELGVPGVNLLQEYRRYFPAGEVASQVVGYTDMDDQGQEGLELAYDAWLRGVPGKKRVLQDRLRRVVEDVESIAEPQPGRDLAISIDLRLQYLAYRELKAAVQKHQARSASMVLLDAQTGEVLAMVNQPSFNPNSREVRGSGEYRNRAMTDPFEPGSTIKPFTVACGLESGRYRPDTPVDTGAGTWRVGRYTVRDVHRYGRIDVATVIKKSSNVGVAKIALSLPAQNLWSMYSRIGLGTVTSSGFPGESTGLLGDYRHWRPIEHATMAFGYGVSVNALQLAQAYAVLGSGGVKRPVTFQRVSQAPPGEQVIDPRVVAQIMPMLETVVSDEGTAKLARIPGYRVAGKTGTVRKMGAGGYSHDRYLSLFVGLAPATRPRLAMAVMIDEPHGKAYYGGLVAAPVFAQVMAGALRLLNIPPDDIDPEALRLAGQGDGTSP